MISGDLTAKIADFGLSRNAYQDRDYVMSMTEGKKKVMCINVDRMCCLALINH